MVQCQMLQLQNCYALLDGGNAQVPHASLFAQTKNCEHKQHSRFYKKSSHLINSHLILYVLQNNQSSSKGEGKKKIFPNS